MKAIERQFVGGGLFAHCVAIPLGDTSMQWECVAGTRLRGVDAREEATVKRFVLTATVL